MSILWELFISFFKIGLLSFGGGYAALPLIQEYIVEDYGWLTVTEFTNLITISQMTPGPIAINAATFIGNQISGILGAIVATLGVITPSIVIVTILTLLYYKYRELPLLQKLLKFLRPTVVALISVAAIGILTTALFGEEFLGIHTLKIYMFVIFLMSMYLLSRQLSPVRVMLMAGLLNILQDYLLN